MVRIEEIAKEDELVDYTGTPNEFTGTFVSEKANTDNTEIVFNIKISENNLTLTQRYKKIHLKHLLDFMRDNNVKDTKELFNKKIIFKKRYFRQGYPRWVPVKIID